MNTSIALAEADIRARLSPAAACSLARLSLFDSTPSTNDYLLDLPAAERHAHAVLADHQSSGKGRRGRRWQSPAGCNIYFSLGWNFSRALVDFSSLPLVVGVAAAQALQRHGVAGVGLKWPNDIQVGGKKLGGILVESRPLSGGSLSVVIGIGVNVFTPPVSIDTVAIDQPWTSVDQQPGFLANPAALEGLREALAGSLLDQLILALAEFQASGFKEFHPQWQQRDVLRGKTVTVTAGSQPAQEPFQGVAAGVDSAGSLLVRLQTVNSERMVALNAGEVSVRIQS